MTRKKFCDRCGHSRAMHANKGPCTAPFCVATAADGTLVYSCDGYLPPLIRTAADSAAPDLRQPYTELVTEAAYLDAAELVARAHKRVTRVVPSAQLIVSVGELLELAARVVFAPQGDTAVTKLRALPEVFCVVCGRTLANHDHLGHPYTPTTLSNAELAAKGLCRNCGYPRDEHGKGAGCDTYCD